MSGWAKASEIDEITLELLCPLGEGHGNKHIMAGEVTHYRQNKMTHWRQNRRGEVATLSKAIRIVQRNAASRIMSYQSEIWREK